MSSPGRKSFSKWVLGTIQKKIQIPRPYPGPKLKELMEMRPRNLRYNKHSEYLNGKQCFKSTANSEVLWADGETGGEKTEPDAKPFGALGSTTPPQAQVSPPTSILSVQKYPRARWLPSAAASCPDNPPTQARCHKCVCDYQDDRDTLSCFVED